MLIENLRHVKMLYEEIIISCSLLVICDMDKLLGRSTDGKKSLKIGGGGDATEIVGMIV